MVARFVFGIDFPEIFGFTWVIVMSGSMQPTLDVDDMLIIHEQGSYELNDIITYREGKNLVTHRVVSTLHSNGGTYVTKGDFNNVPDEPITNSDIEGKVVVRIPRFGGLILYISSPLGLLIVTLGVLFLIEFPYLLERLKRLKK